MAEGSGSLPILDPSAVLPPHVDPCDCTGSRFAVRAETDGVTRAYLCNDCDGLLADLIEGAEP